MLVLSQSRTDYLGRYTPLAASNGKHDPLPSRMVEVRKLASSDKGERHIGGNHIGSRLGLGRFAWGVGVVPRFWRVALWLFESRKGGF